LRWDEGEEKERGVITTKIPQLKIPTSIIFLCVTMLSALGDYRCEGGVRLDGYFFNGTLSFIKSGMATPNISRSDEMLNTAWTIE
jgi:hypothetical protein